MLISVSLLVCLARVPVHFQLPYPTWLQSSGHDQPWTTYTIAWMNAHCIFKQVSCERVLSISVLAASSGTSVSDVWVGGCLSFSTCLLLATSSAACADANWLPYFISFSVRNYTHTYTLLIVWRLWVPLQVCPLSLGSSGGGACVLVWPYWNDLPESFSQWGKLV